MSVLCSRICVDKTSVPSIKTTALSNTTLSFLSARPKPPHALTPSLVLGGILCYWLLEEAASLNSKLLRPQDECQVNVEPSILPDDPEYEETDNDYDVE